MEAIATASSRSIVLNPQTLKPSAMNRIGRTFKIVISHRNDILGNGLFSRLNKETFPVASEAMKSCRGIRAMTSSSEKHLEPDEKQLEPDVIHVDKSQSQPQGIDTRRERRGGAIHRSPVNAIFDIWDPLFPVKDLRQMIQSVDRIFEGLLPAAVHSDWSTWKSDVIPHLSWDIRETAEYFEVHSDVPGLKKEDLKVFVEDGHTLVISGERKVEDTDDNWKKRRYTNYKTSLVLPENVNVDEIEAELKHGVLELKIPKSQQAEKPAVKEIDVK